MHILYLIFSQQVTNMFHLHRVTGVFPFFSQFTKINTLYPHKTCLQTLKLVSTKFFLKNMSRFFPLLLLSLARERIEFWTVDVQI